MYNPAVTIRASLATALAPCVLSSLISLLVLASGNARGAAPILELAAREAEALARVDSLRVAFRAEEALSLIANLLPGARPRSLYLLDLRLRQGALQASIGYPRDSEETLRPALDLAWSLGDTARACVAMRWLAVAIAGEGKIEESAVRCRRLLEIARARADSRHEGWGLVGLAWAAEQEGHLVDATAHYREAARIFGKAGDPRSESWAWNGVGSALTSTGAYGEAREAFTMAAALARDTGYRMVEALAANNLGKLEYGLGDPGIAASWFSRAASIHRALGEERVALIPRMNLAMCDAQLGRYGDASDTLTAILDRCRREGYGGTELAGALRNLAEVRDMQGRHRQADRLRREILSNHSPLRNRIEAAIGIAKSLAGRDSVEEAIALLGRTGSTLPAVCDPGVRIDLETSLGRIQFDAKHPREALEHLRLADRLARERGLAGARVEPLAWSGRAWRAVGVPDSARSALRRAARIWEEERRVPVEAEWRERRGLEGRMICTELADLVLGVDGPASAYETAQRFKSRTLLERMDPSAIARSDADSGRARSGGARASGAAVPLDRVRESLGEKELLLDFYLGPDRSLLFAITRDSCHAVSLEGDSEIEPKSRLYHLLLSRPPSRAAREASDDGPLVDAGRAVRQILLGKIEGMVSASRSVIVSPDGAVNLVPFAALEEKGAAEGPAPAAVRTWTRIPSASILVFLRSRARTDPDHRPHELPGPDGSEGEILAIASGNGSLPWARREAIDLDRAYRGVDLRLVPGRDTLRMADLAAPRVLHIAGHVEVNDERPWRSAVAIGARPLSAEAIARAGTGADLAFLSGCRSTQSRVLSGEGALGLSSAFLSAGASCVVGTLWRVEDRVTARFVKRFYQELAAGRDVATALRRSQEALRTDRETRHPFYWAGFVPIGLGEVRVPLRPRMDPRWLLLVLAAGGLAGLGLAVRVHRGQVPVIPTERARLSR